MRTMGQVGNDLYTGKTSFPFVGRRRLWFIIAAILIVASALVPLVKPIQLSIEFTGGSQFTVTGLSAPDQALATDAVQSVVPGATVKVATVGTDGVRVETDQMSNDETQAVRAALADGGERRVEPREFAAYTLDDAGLDALLDDAPREESGRAGILLSVPSPEGDLVDFRVVESPVMEPGLAAAHPEIATYAGTAVDSAASIRLDVTPMGFHASVRAPGEASWYVDPAFNGDDSVYLSYLGSSLPKKGNLVEPEAMAHEHADEIEQLADGARTGEAAGDTVSLRTYRLALVTDPSYARYFGTENVLAEKVTLMNRVNQIYNDDLAVRMLLVDGTDKLNLDTEEKAWGADGPCGPVGCFTVRQFDNGCTSGLLNRNQFALGQLIGPENYDVGHIALGINGGGVAGLGVVGSNGKARGCTGLPQPEGDFMAIDYVAHEIGHQFGGNHTFNGTQLNCGGNKAAPSVEPGSGSSVMAYAGICRQDDLQPHTDPYFSQWSQFEMTNHIVSKPTVNEVQTVILSGFDTDGESFTVTVNGQTTAPIVRGSTTYTTTAIRTAINAILPAGGSSTVAALGGSGTLNDTGFQVTFSGTALAGTDLEPVVVAGSEGVSAVVSETTKGGMATNGGFEVDVTDNHAPVVTTPDTVTIPLRTPFALAGQATDADGDALVYSWEQTDRGAGTGTSLVSQTKTNGPLFRVFGTYADVTPAGTLLLNSPGQNVATSDPTRTFPDLEQILVNNTNAETGLCPEPPAAPTTGGSNVPVPTRDCFSEWLPTVDYVGSTQAGNNDPVALNFRLTARDQKPGGGGYGFANTKVLIDNTAGPFLVSSKNTPAAAVAGRTEVVTWAVAGTNKPTLAENVKISLSTDGGRTYPIVLAESTPNDGTEPIVWPNVATDTARIKIEAVGNVFFDVNNADFQIVPRLLEDAAGVENVDATAGAELGPVVIATAESGAATGAELTATATGLPEGLSVEATPVSEGAALPGQASFAIAGTPAEAGTYPVTVTITDGQTEQALQLTVTVAVAADTTAPETTITSGPAEGSLLLSRSTTIGFASSEAGSTFTCAVDGKATECADGTLALAGLASGTHQVSITATDAAGNTDASPATRTFTVPVDDRQLKRNGTWTSVPNGAFLGTSSVAKKKGVSLSTSVSGATSLSLLAKSAPKAGAVKVVIGGKVVARISLKGKAGWKVIAVRTGAPVSGTVRIVTTNAKPVRIDGLAVVTRR